MPLRWIHFFFWLYLLVLVGAEATATNPADPDLWHRLAVGQYLWSTSHFPVGETFSYLADYHEIADHEWGSGAIFYTAWVWGGGAAMVGIKIVTLAVTLVLLALAGMQGRRPTPVLAGFYALILLALLPSFQSTVRCMVFTNLFFALWLYWYQLERRGRATPLWAYLITTGVWANLHGGFALGLLWLAGVAALEFVQARDWKRWSIRFVACSLATLINPFGWNLWISTARALVISRNGFDEWAPVSWWPGVVEYIGFKVLLLVVLGLLALLIPRQRWKRVDQSAIIFIAGALVLSLLSVRHTALFAAVSGAFLPELFPPTLDRDPEADPLGRMASIILRSALVVFPLFAALRALPGDGLQLKYPDVSCPVAAVDFLQRENIRGKLLVPFNYGSYALWQLRGRMRVSVDGRYDLVYLPATYRRVEDFFFARGDWAALLRAPAPQAILLRTADPVYAKLKNQTAWQEAYHDTTDAVFLPR